MRHVQRGGSIAESTQEAVSFDAVFPEAISKAINDTIERMAVRVVSVSLTHAPRIGGTASPNPNPEPGPWHAIVVFEEDL